MNIADKIGNSSLLTDIFSEWPSFHDAEVLKISLDRAPGDQFYGPNLESEIHVFAMTGEIDEKGFCELTKHTLVRLAFLEVYELSLTGFNHQNVLWALGIVDISDRQLERIKFQVTFAGSWGIAAKFQCAAIKVRSVQPFVPDELVSDGRGIQSKPKAGAYQPNE
jgi:hypothetical protein